MGESWENHTVSKKELIHWLQQLATTYKDLQYLYRDRIDYSKEIATINAIADYVYYMKPANAEKAEEK